MGKVEPGVLLQIRVLDGSFVFLQHAPVGFLSPFVLNIFMLNILLFIKLFRTGPVTDQGQLYWPEAEGSGSIQLTLDLELG